MRTGDPTRMRATLLAKGYTVTEDDDGRWVVEGAGAEQIGAVAAREGIPVLELADERASLEQAYLALTTDETEFAAATPASPTVPQEA